MKRFINKFELRVQDIYCVLEIDFLPKGHEVDCPLMDVFLRLASRYFLFKKIKDEEIKRLEDESNAIPISLFRKVYP